MNLGRIATGQKKYNKNKYITDGSAEKTVIIRGLDIFDLKWRLSWERQKPFKNHWSVKKLGFLATEHIFDPSSERYIKYW